MRTTILGLALLSAVSLAACGSGDDAGSASDTCAVFPMITGPLQANVTEQIVEFGGSCLSYDDGRVKYTGVSEEMTVYKDGKPLARDRWEVYDVRRIRLLGAYAFGDANLSVSYGCTAKSLIQEPISGCGYINEAMPRQPNR